MKVVIVTDAWSPQVNGVVRTLKQTSQCLEQLGHQVHLITPESFKTLPCPSYPSIPLALFPGRKVARLLESYHANAIHIATEGPQDAGACVTGSSLPLPTTPSFRNICNYEPPYHQPGATPG